MSEQSSKNSQDSVNDPDLSRRRFVAWMGSLPVLLHAAAPVALAKSLVHGSADAIQPGANYPFRPFVRWWWFSGDIKLDDLQYQLDWVKSAGFSGVEIGFESNKFAVDYAGDRNNVGVPFVSPALSNLALQAKKEAEARGLRCDFTFGAVWPFGGPFLAQKDASQSFAGVNGPSEIMSQYYWGSQNDPGYELNHLSRQALENYSAMVGKTLEPALRFGKPSAVFCDSLELTNADSMWSESLWVPFAKWAGYDLRPLAPSLDQPGSEAVRYDYRKFVGHVMNREFFAPFTEISHKLGSYTRVQCQGAPVDLIEAYSLVDVPETESILFNPYFGRVAASAAALSGKPVVSCETFTCLYGFPREHMGEESVNDMKVLVDALISNGVNHFVYHVMPYTPRNVRQTGYATVFISPLAPIAKDIPELNQYVTKLTTMMRPGETYSDIATYFPLEDMRMKGAVPQNEQTPGESNYWEMRRVQLADGVKNYSPLWISNAFLKKARVVNGRLQSGKCSFRALTVQSAWLDEETIAELLRLGRQGLPIVMPEKPQIPGKRRSTDANKNLDALMSLPNVKKSLSDVGFKPLVEADEVLPYWAKKHGSGVRIFFAHPATRDLKYPMPYHYAETLQTIRKDVKVNYRGKSYATSLEFNGSSPCMIDVSSKGVVHVPL